MYTTQIVACTIVLNSLLHPFFTPLTMKEKSEGADLIAIGTVVSVTRLMPENSSIAVETNDAHYMGPGSVAVVEVSETWKRPEKTPMFKLELLKAGPETHSVQSVTPKYIMVPCDYSFHESPSELTNGRNYVLFLRQTGNNIYHPLDPASTHVISEGRVAKFGMNHPPRDNFIDKSTAITKFKAGVIKFLKTQKNQPQPKGGG